MSALTAVRPRLPGLPWVSGLQSISTSVGSTVTFTMNGAGDKIGLPFDYDGENVPDLASFPVSSLTSTGTVDVTLETFDATTGFASGTPVTGSNLVSVSVSATGVKNTATGMAGTAASNMTKGGKYVVVLTATTGFAGNFVITYATGTIAAGWPVIATKDSAGAWTKATTQGSGGYYFGFKNAGGSYFRVPGYAGAASSYALQSFNSGTNPFERGSLYVPEVAETVEALFVACNQGSTPADAFSLTAKVYSDPLGTPALLASAVMDGDLSGVGMIHRLVLDTSLDLTGGTIYGLVVQATGGSNINFPRYDFQAQADLDCMFGSSNYAITRNGGAGAFTADTDSFYTIVPVDSRFHDGAGGGGSGGGGPLIGGRLVQ